MRINLLTENQLFPSMFSFRSYKYSINKKKIHSSFGSFEATRSTQIMFGDFSTWLTSAGGGHALTFGGQKGKMRWTDKHRDEQIKRCWEGETVRQQIRKDGENKDGMNAVSTLTKKKSIFVSETFHLPVMRSSRSTRASAQLTSDVAISF